MVNDGREVKTSDNLEYFDYDVTRYCGNYVKVVEIM